MKKFILIALAIVGLMVYGLASAETSRLGNTRYSFNQTATISKTAAYTLTLTDSLVNVACTTADIVITLPAISTVLPGGKTYKIKKTDSKMWAVIVTPATGDTIGGEATRYITGTNGYVVISEGSGKNWTVDFESDITAPDYSLGTVAVVTGKSSRTTGGIVFKDSTGKPYRMFPTTLGNISTIAVP